jgi:hypothetical protein
MAARFEVRAVCIELWIRILLRAWLMLALCVHM